MALETCPHEGCENTLTYDENPCPECGRDIEWIYEEPQLDKIPYKPGGWKPVKPGQGG